MNKVQEVIRTFDFKKVIALLVLVGMFVLFSDMLNLILLTFIFSFLFSSLCNWIEKVIKNRVNVSRKAIVLSVYGLFLAVLGVGGVLLFPLIAKEVSNIVNMVSHFKLDDYKSVIHPKLYEIIQNIDLESYLKEAGTKTVELTRGVGSFLISLFIGFLLSFFLIWERDVIRVFWIKIKSGKSGFIFEYCEFFAKSFTNTFGKVLQLQILISFINSALSTITLYFLGFHQVLGLGAMIFAFGLIPVAGVALSLIPLSLLALKLGGIIKLVYILVMILVLHAFEAYVLNPKLMSVHMKLPVFLSFSVLVFSEHTLGIWGLFIGIPLFMFLVEYVQHGSQNVDKIEAQASLDPKSE
jgi:predicted PurR-regulated permease PerM